MAYDLILDAGHGGSDPGAVGPTGLQEKDVTLVLVKKVGALLTAQGYGIGYTRTTDVFVALDDRAAVANNAKYKQFMSIHINSAAVLATGTETYCYKTGGEGEKMATAVQTKLVGATTLYNRGVKTANFAVLRETAMTAILTEVAFISNPSEEALLKDDAFLDRVAKSLAVGYCAYRGDTYKEASTVVPPVTTAPTVADNTAIEQLKTQINGYKITIDSLTKQVASLKDQLALSGDTAGLRAKLEQVQKDLDTASSRAVVAEREVERLNGLLTKWDNLKKLCKDFIGGI